ncbi:MAG: SLC13 family permease [Candidatus Dormibacteria bacterium]
MLAPILLLVLFLSTAAAVTARPWRVPAGWWPLAAVALGLTSGLLSFGTAADGLISSLDVLAFFAGLLLLAVAVRHSGWMGWVLDRAEAWSRGDPRRLLLAVAAATVVVTGLLSNDAAALVLAPAVFQRLESRRLPIPAFALTMAFSANAASTLLPISNPVNLLILDRSHLALGSYMQVVSAPALVAVLITTWACLAWTGRLLPLPAQAPLKVAAVEHCHPGLSRLGFLVGMLILTDVAFAAFHLPIGPATLAAGGLAALTVRRESGALGWLRSPGWSILGLVAGFSILASGLAQSGWLAGVAGGLPLRGLGWLGALSVGLVTALISGGINNLPGALLVTAGLHSAHHLGGLALNVIVGADLGPNLAPFGSLSTILILAAAGRHGQPVPWGQILRLGLAVGPIALLPTICLVALGH